MTSSARVTAALLVILSGVVPVHAQDQNNGEGDSVWRWRDRPSFQFGDVRLDVRLKLAYDWRRFDPEIDEDDGSWRMRRGGINGEIGDHVEFQIERDYFRGGDWRDVFVAWRTFRRIELTAGRFKVPFGREQNVSSSDIDFAERALVSGVIPPGRATGVMANGSFLQRGITYEAGVFDDDGDNGRLPEEQDPASGERHTIGSSFAARVSGTPLRRFGPTFDTLRVAWAIGGTRIPEGQNSLRGESLYGTTEFFESVYVNGRRTRMGAEFTYTPGPFSITAEWMQSREQRKQPGTGNADLSDLITTGWYTAATWLVTSDNKEDFEAPRNALFDGGIGAIEVAIRYERLGFESTDKTGVAAADPRAAHILGNSDHVWTVGLNWFVNRWIRATVNAMREDFQDAARTPRPGTTRFWSGLGRLQLVF